MRNFLGKLDNGILFLEKWGITISLLLMIGMVFMNVVLRSVLEFSVGWADEATRFSQIFAVYFGMGAAFRFGAHVSVDVVIRYLIPLKAHKAFDLFAHIVTLLFCIFLLYSGVMMTIAQYNTGAVSAILGFPRWIIYACVPFGMITAIIHELSNIAEIAAKNYMEEKEGEVTC